MTGLARMRLAAFIRGGRWLAPLIVSLVTLGVLYGGGPSPAGQAYGVSAALLFPVIAWQTKLLLDAEPDTQRRLTRVAVGSAAREVGAGLLAAGVAAAVTVGLALVLPWVVGGISAPATARAATVASAFALGLWVHLIAVPAAVAVGGLASRAVTRSAGYGVVTLVGSAVASIVLGLRSSPAPWLVPPLMPTARAVAHGVSAGAAVELTGWALVWSAVALAWYMRLRRGRA